MRSDPKIHGILGAISDFGNRFFITWDPPHKVPKQDYPEILLKMAPKHSQLSIYTLVDWKLKRE